MANALKAKRSAVATLKGNSDIASSTSAIYLYGVSRDGVASPRGRRASGSHAERPTGVDGVGRLESLPCAGLLCWISRVDRGNYADRLAQNMENLDWLAAASVRHQRVVGTLAAERDVLPARFGTVFLQESSLEADIRARKKTITAALARIAGAEEWGVKVFVESSSSAPLPVERARTGRDYLKQKAVMLQQRARVIVPPEIGGMQDALSRVALDSVAAKPATAQAGLVWQGAFLVNRGATSRFHSVLAKFARTMKQARIETSGPWPPYSFVDGPAERGGTSHEANVRRRPKPSRRSGTR